MQLPSMFSVRKYLQEGSAQLLKELRNLSIGFLRFKTVYGFINIKSSNFDITQTSLLFDLIRIDFLSMFFFKCYVSLQ